jgi:HK97 family phage prohead protease
MPDPVENYESFRTAVLALEVSGNGRTVGGLAVPYAVQTEITDHRGHYQEMIAPGAFDSALRSSRPKMFFEHGLDLRMGRTPIGSFDRVWGESDGVHVSGQLFDNDLVRPLADAVRSGELREWSIHFKTALDGSGETWKRSGGTQMRTVLQAKLPEISLVNFGAYPTTLSVRSILDRLTLDPDGAASGEAELDEESEPDDSSQRLQAALKRDRSLRILGII